MLSNKVNLIIIYLIIISYKIICFLIYYSGLHYLISFLRRHKPVILMYHSINQENHPHIYPDNIVSIDNFGGQLAYLYKKKSVISLSSLVGYIKKDVEIPPNSVVLTFDDGYHDFYTNAYPILKKYNIPCTVFPITKILETGEIKWEDELSSLINTTKRERLEIRIREDVKTYDLDSESRRTRCLRDLLRAFLELDESDRNRIIHEIKKMLRDDYAVSEKIMLNWNEVLELSKDGLVSIGCHTHSHRNLAKVSQGEAEIEISEAKKLLKEHLGIQCNHFSYPFGKKRHYTQAIKEILRSRGFSSAVTTVPGSNGRSSDVFELRRIAAIDDSSYMFKCSLIGIALQRS